MDKSRMQATKRYSSEEESTTEQPSQDTITHATKRRAKGSSITMPIPLEKFLDIKLITLKKTPAVLSSWIRKNPGDIVQIESPKTDNGFNAFAWREQISSNVFGSNLYSSNLCLENLNTYGEINERFKVTYTEVKRLADESKWENSLPDTIFVKTTVGPKKRMVAKKMVLELLDSYQKDPELPNKPTNKPVLKETQTDDLGDGKCAIEFSVKGITQIEPIMSPNTFMSNFKDSFSEVLAALRTYQNKLWPGVVNGFRVEEVFFFVKGDKEPHPSPMFTEIADAAQSLQETLNAEIYNKGKTGLTQTELTILSRLQKQVKSAIEDGFKNELDTRRWQLWLMLNPKQWQWHKPLTEDVIVPGTEKQIGAGAQGPVFQYDLDPELGKSPVVLKYDSNGINDDAGLAGIPDVNPQQSLRAVAAFEISKRLNLGVIPRTEFFVGTDDNGRPKLGQAMEVVNGAIGQRRVGLKNKEVIDPVQQKDLTHSEYVVKNPGNLTQDELRNYQDEMLRYVKVNGKWYTAEIFPVDIKYGDAVVQKGLSDLQVFDYIIGHADRNPGNWIYEKDKNGNIIGVKGIDNDDTFGEKWALKNPNYHFPSERGSKTPGIPPIVDISTALSILSADFNQVIKPFLAGLSPDEITKAAVRFARVQQEVRQRVTAGKIASMGDVDQAKLLKLRNKVPDMVPMPDIPRWGTQEIADTHTDQNSYLGLQVSVKTYLAKQYSKTGGVLPESGDALL